MNYKLSVSSKPVRPLVTPLEMQTGDLGEIVEGLLEGHLPTWVMKVGPFLYLLGTSKLMPHLDCSLKIKLLGEGESITLTGCPTFPVNPPA